MNFPHLATRLFNVPLAIHPAKAEIVMAALSERLGITHILHPAGPAARNSFALDAPASDRAYDVVSGIAIVPVTGTLVQKLGAMQAYSGMCGYDGIRANFMQALADPEVQAVALHIDSPGGEVAGCFDLADLIHQARGAKPIHAILDENAFSAAYAIASAADRITVPRTGGTGSIGVIAMHVDMSKALTTAGVTVTMITHGARKSDGSQYAAISADALSRFQADIDTMGTLFTATVARNRGLKPADVAAMEAATFLGAAGVAAGLADAVAAPDQAFRDLLASVA